jgi:UPF0755 protein
MKSFFKVALSLLVLLTTILVLGIAGGSYWAYEQYKNLGPLKEKRLIKIPRGSSVYAISEILLYNGVIDINSFTPVNIFVHASKITKQAGKLKAGEYEFPPHISMKEVLDKLEKGEVFARKITIREGLTNYEITRILRDQKDLYFADIPQYPEGHLLPETYSFTTGDSIADIAMRMNNAMEKALNEAWENRAEGLPIKTKEEALVLASIIEKETAVSSERKRVAGVFVNRLRAGIALQSDPTVIYALTEGKPKNNGKGPLGRRLLKKDLEIDSPYNTYKYRGLPPTPIANPGRASIEAVLNPEVHKYIYFVADGSGGHAFAQTLSEHNENVAKWRKLRHQKGK